MNPQQQQEMMQMLSMVIQQQQMQGLGYFQSPASSVGRASIRHQGGSWGQAPGGLATFLGDNFGMLGGLVGQFAQGPMESWLGGQGFTPGGFGRGFSHMDRRLNAQYNQGLNIATSSAREADLQQVQNYASRVSAMRYHDDDEAAQNATTQFMSGYRKLSESQFGGMALEQLHKLLPGGSSVDFATRLYDAAQTNQLGRGTQIDPGMISEFAQFARDRWVGGGQVDHGAMRGFDMGDFGKMAQALAQSGSLDLVANLQIDEADMTRKMENAGQQLEKLAGVLDAVRELTGSHDAPIEVLMQQLDVLTAGGLTTGTSLDNMERTIHRARALGRQSQITDEAMFDMMSRQSERAVGLGYHREAGLGIAERTAAMAGSAWAYGADTYNNMTFEQMTSFVAAEQEDMLTSQGVRAISALSGMRGTGVDLGEDLNRLLDEMRDGTISDEDMARLIKMTDDLNIRNTLEQSINETGNTQLRSWFAEARDNDRLVADNQRQVVEQHMGALLHHRRDQMVESMANRALRVTGGGVERESVEAAMNAALAISQEDMDAERTPQARENLVRQTIIRSLMENNPGMGEEQAGMIAHSLFNQMDTQYGGVGAFIGTYSDNTRRAAERNMRTAEISAAVEMDIRDTGAGVGRGVLSELLTGFLNPDNMNEDGSVNYAAVLSQASGGFDPTQVEELIRGNAGFRSQAERNMGLRNELEEIHTKIAAANAEGNTDEVKRLEEEANKKREELTEGMKQLAAVMNELGIAIKRTDARQIRGDMARAASRLAGTGTAHDTLEVADSMAESLTLTDSQKTAILEQFGDVRGQEIIAQQEARLARVNDIRKAISDTTLDDSLTEEERTAAINKLRTALREESRTAAKEADTAYTMDAAEAVVSGSDAGTGPKASAGKPGTKVNLQTSMGKLQSLAMRGVDPETDEKFDFSVSAKDGEIQWDEIEDEEERERAKQAWERFRKSEQERAEKRRNSLIPAIRRTQQSRDNTHSFLYDDPSEDRRAPEPMPKVQEDTVKDASSDASTPTPIKLSFTNVAGQFFEAFGEMTRI